VASNHFHHRDSLQSSKQQRKDAAAQAVTRRRDEAYKPTRHQQVRALCAVALDNANAIDGGSSPPKAGDMADALIHWRAALVVNERLRWLDALGKGDATPLRLFILDQIRNASPKTRRAAALPLKKQLSESQWCLDFGMNSC
jgi:hypothetical protein